MNFFEHSGWFLVILLLSFVLGLGGDFLDSNFGLKSAGEGQPFAHSYLAILLGG